MLSKNTHLAIKASIEAGKEILKIYHSGDFEIEKKKDNSPLTKADKEAHRIIESILQKSGIPILSEEGKSIPFTERKKWPELWIIDPIDGTKEFIKRNGEFTVNIALVKNNTPIIGVVYAPELKTIYFSECGVGAYKKELRQEQINISDIVTTSLSLPEKQNRQTFTIVASRSHLSKETEEYLRKMKKTHEEISLISKGSSLKLVMVAEGSADCYPRFAPTMEWDTAAGQAICEHAGFKVTDWETKKQMMYNRENLLNNWFLAHK